MRIALIVGSFPVVSQPFIANQVAGLLDQGCDVQIFAIGKRGGGVAEHKIVTEYDMLSRAHYPIGNPDTTMHRMAFRTKHLMQYGWRHPASVARGASPARFGKRAFSLFHSTMALNLSRNGPFDVVHIHFGTIALISLDILWAAKCNAPLVVTFHGSDINEVLPDGTKHDYSELFEQAALVTANSRFTARRLMVAGCPSKKVTRVPMGVSMRSFPVIERERAPGDPLRFLTVGRVVPVKGIDYVIRALPKVAQVHPDVEYHVVGPPNLRDKYMKLATELGVADHVTFHGAKPHHEIVDFLKMCDIFVLAGVVAPDGTVEAQGLVLAEAQATGMPIIASNVGGIPETTGDGRAGMLVEQKNVEELADAMIKLAAMRDEWPRLGRLGREYVEKRYGIERSTQRMLGLYEKACALATK